MGPALLGPLQAWKLHMRPSVRVLIALLLSASAVYAQPPDICGEVATARSAYGPTISPAEAVTILNVVAYAHRTAWGLLEAPPGGNGGPHPSGKRVRLDRLVRRADTRIFDVFTDGPDSRPGEPERNGVAGPACQDDGAVSPVYVVEATPPEGQPDPGTVVPDLGTLLSALEAHDRQMEAGIDSLRAQIAQHTRHLESLASEHARMLTEPEPEPEKPKDDQPWWVKLLTLWWVR